jgi:hypothetical protein
MQSSIPKILQERRIDPKILHILTELSVCLSVCLARFWKKEEEEVQMDCFCITNKQRGRKKETSAASPPLGGGYSADGSAPEGAEERKRAYVWRLPGRAKESGSDMLLFTATPSADSCSCSFVCLSVRLFVFGQEQRRRRRRSASSLFHSQETGRVLVEGRVSGRGRHEQAGELLEVDQE